MITWGDPDLAAQASARLNRDEPFIAVLVDGAITRRAGSGIEEAADVEIGSVSKALTGLLLHDSIDRGEVTMATRLGDLLDLGSGPVGDVTLASLATHTSGLPRLAPAADTLRKTWRLLRHAENPYGESLDQLLHRVRDIVPKGTKPSYSNLGFMLLGHAVAAAAGQSYASLVQSRLADPLGLSGLYVPVTDADLSPAAVRGRNRLGKLAEPWTGEALGPAGGVRATADDLAGLLAALLTATAPGLAALDPVRAFSGKAVRIGAGWLVLELEGRDYTWHNGGTGGFRSIVALDRPAGRGVAVVRGTTRSADGAGFGLLRGQ